MSRERFSSKEKRRSKGNLNRRSTEIGPGLVHFVEESSAVERALTKIDETPQIQDPNYRALQIEKAAKLLESLPQETPRGTSFSFFF